MDQENSRGKMRTFHPISKFLWCTSGAWIALFATALFISTVDVGLSAYMIFCYGGFVLIMLLGYSWFREVVVKNAESQSTFNFILTIALTIIAAVCLPIGCYLQSRPVFLPETSLISLFSRYEIDLDRLAQLRSSNPNLLVKSNQGLIQAFESKLTVEEVSIIAKRLEADQLITAVEVAPGPFSITIACKIPKTTFYEPLTQGIAYAKELPKKFVLLAKDQSLTHSAKSRYTTCKHIKGNWYAFVRRGIQK
jgi:hypothetical protein